MASGVAPEREARVRAIQEDMEYYRTKRLEPRLLHFVRRGILPLPDLLDARAPPSRGKPGTPRTKRGGVDGRIAALERGLNEYIRGIGAIAWGLSDAVDMVVEDQRKEAGTYDAFFKVAKRHYPEGLEARVAALEGNLKADMAVLAVFTAALVRKGLLPKEAVKPRPTGPTTPAIPNGARIVARAWADPGFKARLRAKGRGALDELGLPTGGVGRLGVVEDTHDVHNVVVCTLCSCYPYDLLGNPPWWYKHDVYKERIVADPRGTLGEMFGLALPASWEVRVHDSTSDIRYMVIPRRPPGTEGMDEGELAGLVTADSLIGTGEAAPPGRAAVTGARPQRSARSEGRG